MSEVLLIAQDQIRRYGGTYGLRDPSLLSSALAMPRATFEGRLLHEDIYLQAAAYAFHICQNHPFVDGNKRTGLAAALVFLALNGVELLDPDEKLYEMMVGITQRHRDKAQVAETFKQLRARTRKK